MDDVAFDEAALDVNNKATECDLRHGGGVACLSAHVL